jgi:exopolysaccharide biosynthesis WecB/TagA/CpsF family protein
MLARSQFNGVERATGADLIRPLSEAAAETHVPVFLFGTSADVMAKAGRELGHLTDGAIDIAGTLAPSSSFDPEGPEADAAIETIRASGARLCYVALGAPKQEIFIAHALSRDLKCGLIGIGAALDFIAGAQVRAPKAFRDNGLEWAWRLGSNPRRLARRYFECAVLFADLTVVASIRSRLQRFKAN